MLLFEGRLRTNHVKASHAICACFGRPNIIWNRRKPPKSVFFLTGNVYDDTLIGIIIFYNYSMLEVKSIMLINQTQYQKLSFKSYIISPSDVLTNMYS